MPPSHDPPATGLPATGCGRQAWHPGYSGRKFIIPAREQEQDKRERAPKWPQKTKSPASSASRSGRSAGPSDSSWAVVSGEPKRSGVRPATNAPPAGARPPSRLHRRRDCCNNERDAPHHGRDCVNHAREAGSSVSVIAPHRIRDRGNRARRCDKDSLEATAAPPGI